MSRLSHRPIDPVYYIEDCGIFSLNAQSEIQILKDSNLLMLCMIVRIEISLSTFNIPAKKFMNTGFIQIRFSEIK